MRLNNSNNNDNKRKRKKKKASKNPQNSDYLSCFLGVHGNKRFQEQL